MKIFVCIKQVPDTETKIKFLPDNSGIDSTGVKWVMNPYDEFAVEEAIKLRDANAGSQLFVLSVGPKKRIVESIRTALAMGADEGIAVDATEGIDNFTTAKALAQVIQQEGGAQIIFTGRLAIDDNASSVSQMVAEFLSIPHTTVVSKFTYSAEQVTVEREADGGAKEVVMMKNPCVVAANKGLNMPRYASLPGIMKAKKKTIKELDLSSLGLAGDTQKTKVSQFTFPPDSASVKMLTGDSQTQVAELVKLLRNEAKVL